MSIVKRFLHPIYRILGRPILKRILNRPYFTLDRSALKNGASFCLEFGEQETFHPPQPHGQRPLATELDKKDSQLRAASPFVCELYNVELIGTEGLAITEENKFILEETEADPGLAADVIAKSMFRGTVPVRRQNSVTYHEQPIAILLEQGTDGYYHWMAEYLPQVRGLEKYAEVTETYPNVLIDKDAPNWKRELLRLVGVPEQRMISWDGSRTRAKRYVVTSLPRHGYDTTDPNWEFISSPAALRWVSKRIKTNMNIGTGGTERVIITRQNASTRQLVNSSIVIETLSDFGFEPYVLDEITVKNQVRLFSNAEVVVAPHGAGLVNTIFSDDVKILELFGDYRSGVFYTIAGAFGFTYAYELCKDVNGNLLVNTDKLKDAVQALLDQP